jgi:hypothetical protein
MVNSELKKPKGETEKYDLYIYIHTHTNLCYISCIIDKPV